MVVDLPAPFGPRNPSTSPRSHGEAHAVDGEKRAEPLRQRAHLDERFAAGPSGRRLDGGLWG